MAHLPLVGAAMTIPDLEMHRDLIVSENRDLELQDFCIPNAFGEDWRARCDKAREILRDYSGRLGIHGPFRGLSIANADDEIRAITRRKMMEGLDAAAHLGASQMVIHSPFTCWSAHNSEYNNDGEQIRWRIHDTLDDVIRRAATLDCVVVIENIEDVRPEDRLKVVRDFDSPYLKISVDTGHAMFAHDTYGAPPVDYFVRSAGNDLGHVHLQDVDGYADRHWEIGLGRVPWHQVFKSLSQIESDPRLILELRDTMRLSASIDWLKSEGLAR